MTNVIIKKEFLKENHPQKHYLPNLLFHLIWIVTSFYLCEWYLNWVQIESYDERYVFPLLIFPPILGLIIFLNICYCIAYYLEHPVIEAHKITTAPWLWKTDPVFFKKYLPDLVLVYLRNWILFALFTLFYFFWSHPNFNMKERPSLFQHMIQIYVSIVFEDFTFYWSHRLLHLPWFYKRVHKQHHFTADIMHLNCVYTHWFEFVLGNILPFMVGFLVFGQSYHIITYTIFAFYRIIETHEVHCGYEMPVSIFPVFPFSTNATYHNFHHSKNVGNYATFFTFWDDIFGT